MFSLVYYKSKGYDQNYSKNEWYCFWKKNILLIMDGHCMNDCVLTLYLLDTCST